MAERLKKGLREKGCKFLIDSPTNQQFVVLDQDTIRRLEEQVAFSIWEPVDENHTAVRFATSWLRRRRWWTRFGAALKNRSRAGIKYLQK